MYKLVSFNKAVESCDSSSSLNNKITCEFANLINSNQTRGYIVMSCVFAIESKAGIATRACGILWTSSSSAKEYFIV